MLQNPEGSLASKLGVVPPLRKGVAQLVTRSLLSTLPPAQPPCFRRGPLAEQADCFLDVETLIPPWDFKDPQLATAQKEGQRTQGHLLRRSYRRRAARPTCV